MCQLRQVKLISSHVMLVRIFSGKPDGGRGGRGGSVKFVSDKNIKDLSQVLHCYNAKHGGHGSSRGRCGKDGEDVMVVVPTGTVVYRDGEELIDLDGHGAQYIGVVGGEGGQGNIINQDEDEWTYNNEGTHGKESTEVVLQLEMKLLADVGLVSLVCGTRELFIHPVVSLCKKHFSMHSGMYNGMAWELVASRN